MSGTGTLLDVREMRSALNVTFINVTIALQVRELRAERRWTQNDLALEAGISVATVVSVEETRWREFPNLTTLEKIANAFDVGLDCRFTSYGELVKEFLETPEIEAPPDFAHDALLVIATAPDLSGTEGGTKE